MSSLAIVLCSFPRFGVHSVSLIEGRSQNAKAEGGYFLFLRYCHLDARIKGKWWKIPKQCKNNEELSQGKISWYCMSKYRHKLLTVAIFLSLFAVEIVSS